ncbi:hypothetical protein HDV03_005425 [Kappamyces sp. JEL0829]|nr:hypothetical protein HDV03_005425 [Kappamyces sp. JEL0829]
MLAVNLASVPDITVLISILAVLPAVAGHSHGAATNDTMDASMTFHTSFTADTILFSDWVPTTLGAYLGTLVAVFLLALSHHALGKLRAIRKALLRPPTTWTRLEKAFLTCLSSFISYTLMLIIMTFNVGIFCTIIFGIFCGSFLFDPDDVVPVATPRRSSRRASRAQLYPSKSSDC